MSDAGDPSGIPTRILVVGMAHADGSILAQELYPVAEACGQSADQVESCLRTLTEDGLFRPETVDGALIYRATEAGHEALEAVHERTRLAFAQDAAGRGWDRTWHLVGMAPDDPPVEALDAFGRRLDSLGGAVVQTGLWVSAHRWEDAVQAEADRLGLSKHITTATTDFLTIGGVSDPRELAARLWAIDRLADRYRAFVERYHGVPDALTEMRKRKERLTDAEFLGGALTTVLDFQKCFDHDPLLPPELLPRPWPGREARELMMKGRRLGVLAREDHVRPALFSFFDEVVDTLA